MRVRFWGTRGTRPTPGRKTLRYGGNTACVEVRGQNGELVILDAGSGIAEFGATLRGNGPIEAHILVTHTHWDHIQGFPFFQPNFVPGARLTLVGPGGSIKSLQSAFSDQMDPAYFPLRMEQIPAELHFIELEPGQEFLVGTLRVTPHLLNHPIATFGYRIQDGDSSFVFATDNEIPQNGAMAGGALEALAHQQLVDWTRDADLLVHDAQYSDAEYESHVGWGHSTFGGALRLAEDSGARQLAFYHHDPLHTDSDIDALVEEAMGEHQRLRGTTPAAFPAAEDTEIQI